MVQDAALSDLTESEQLLRDDNNQVVVHTDFKDWLVGRTTELVKRSLTRGKYF